MPGTHPRPGEPSKTSPRGVRRYHVRRIRRRNLGEAGRSAESSPFDQLEESTLNAGLAIVHSMRPQSELEALLAVQIIATEFSGLRFLRQSHRHMSEEFIDVYGNYAIKLLRLQAEMIQAFDRYRRGNKQTVEVRHIHLHP